MTRLARPIFKNSNTVHSMSIGICQPSLNSSSYKCLRALLRLFYVFQSEMGATTNLMLMWIQQFTLFQQVIQHLKWTRGKLKPICLPPIMGRLNWGEEGRMGLFHSWIRGKGEVWCRLRAGSDSSCSVSTSARAKVKRQNGHATC